MSRTATSVNSHSLSRYIPGGHLPVAKSGCVVVEIGTIEGAGLGISEGEDVNWVIRFKMFLLFSKTRPIIAPMPIINIQSSFTAYVYNSET